MKMLKLGSYQFTTLALGTLFAAALLITAVPFRVFAATSLLVDRFDQLSDPSAGAVASHVLGLTMADTSQPVGSISFEFCTNSPLPATPCVAPTGFDASAVVLSAQTGEMGFSLHPNSNSNRLVLTRAPLNPTATPSTFTFDTITNPTVTGTHYVRLQTYSSSDATGIDIENGGVAFAILSALNVSAEVPPYIRFCAGITIDNFDCSSATTFLIDFGQLRTNQTSRATSQFVVATNAQSGYSITLSGTTLTSGNNVIPGMASASGSATGASQFGVNLKANSNPAIGSEVLGPGTATANAGYNAPNQFKFQNGDTLVSVPNGNDNRKFTVSYITNINPAQPAGVYATTVTYICLANF